MPLGLFSSLNPRAASSATHTGMVPNVNRNCMASGGISREPSLENKAHPPQQRTQAMEYQNQRALSVPFHIIGNSPFAIVREITLSVGSCSQTSWGRARGKARLIDRHLRRITKTARSDAPQLGHAERCPLHRHDLKEGDECLRHGRDRARKATSAILVLGRADQANASTKAGQVSAKREIQLARAALGRENNGSERAVHNFDGAVPKRGRWQAHGR